MFTPQSIKDQEFQIKFRGCDPIEVKSYLEELADHVFELHEQKRKHNEDMSRLKGELTLAENERTQYKSELAKNQSSAGDIEKKVEKGYQYKDERIAELSLNLEGFQKKLDAQAEEFVSCKKTLDETNIRLAAEQALVSAGKAELEKVQAKNILLEEQLQGLKQEGIDFKSTILLAQQFSEELKKSAEVEATELLIVARTEEEELRATTQVKRDELHAELASLETTRNEVRDEIRQKLQTVLAGLDVLGGPVNDATVDLADLNSLDFSLVDDADVAFVAAELAEGSDEAQA
ncbi:DivIVA domain-containing protein [Desulfotalea psychrophila]|uniref:DivIVA domain-containing protein n=1 Tax=Desulfotalea psychrophila (strain LSv54 / DSM 12343) TaxID=177439 RepID=Q6AQ56_DESPS|nr:DivIVA domain-containing protein [Desulfotalea psychrophila]CAG35517.1 hypothetical protein DP0788 [Desulfotalea psychrophila LSv54]